MTTPVRLQLSRAKGFSIQALSHQTNGLPVFNVTRPGQWGNPYPVPKMTEAIRSAWDWTNMGMKAGEPFWTGFMRLRENVTHAANVRHREAFERLGLDMAISAYDIDLEGFSQLMPDAYRAHLEPLRGHNLACWCAPDCPCHADVLLRRVEALG